MNLKRVLYIILFIYGFLLTGCTDDPVNKNQNSGFFGLGAFMESQLTLLDSLNPKVDKKVRVGESYESKIIQNVDWRKELELFTQADISKPSLQASYDIEDVSDQVRIYKVKENENPSVKYVKVETDEKTGQVISIEASISQTNYLYHSEKKINLQCHAKEGSQTQLYGYQINGFQKLIFRDKVPYQIEAKVLY